MAADHSQGFEQPRRLLQTPACVSLPSKSKWFYYKSLSLSPRTTQDEKSDLQAQHLYANQSVALKEAQVEQNKSWLVENVAPALPSMTEATHTERRTLGWHGRLVGTNSKCCTRGSVSSHVRRMARSYCSSRGSLSSASVECSSEEQLGNLMASDTLPSILISPPAPKVKLLQVMGRQKDICMKNTGPATLNCNAVTPRLPYPVMKSHRYKGKGDSKTRRERTALPFKVFNFSDDKALPRVKVWRGNQAVQLATSQQSYCLKEYSSRN